MILKVTPNGLSLAVGALEGSELGDRVGQTEIDGICEGRALGAELTVGMLDGIPLYDGWALVDGMLVGRLVGADEGS